MQTFMLKLITGAIANLRNIGRNHMLMSEVLLMITHSIPFEDEIRQTCRNRTLVKRAYQKFNFLISQPKHMLWVLKKKLSQ